MRGVYGGPCTALGGASCATCGRAPRSIHARAADQTSLEALEEEHAREPLPLAVRLEQLGRLAGVGPAAAQRREELHERRDRRRAPRRSGRGPAVRSRRPSTGRRRARGRVARARRGARGALRGRASAASRISVAARLAASPHRGHSGRREPRDRLARRRVLSAGADDRPLDLERLRGLDQLAADRANRPRA